METITKPRADFILWVNTNFVANLSIPKKYINTPYKDIVKFLQSHPLHYALTAIPRMYPDMLKEFWSTCEYHPSRNYISGSVCKGEYLIRVTIKGLRDTLKLPHYNEFDPLVTEAEFKRILGICGDNFTTVEESKAKNLGGKTVRSRLPAIWMYLSRTISRSLGIKVGNYTSSMERQIFHSLVTGTNIDYAELIFNELKKNVLEEPRDRYIPYPRFLSLVFHEAMGDNYTQADDLKSMTPIVLGPEIFQKSVKNGDPNLTSAMRRMIKNPYEHLQSKSKAHSSSSEADSSDSELGSSSHCKSKSSSPSNSRNSTLRGISKVILPKTNPTPPPPSETSETSSSQLSKSPSRNKSAETKTIDKGQVPPAKVTATTATLEPNQDRYFTASPSHNHHSSPNNTQRDRPTDTSTILQAIMALTSKVDTISSKVDTFTSDVESVKTGMATAQTITTAQHNILIQELATLKSQIQNYASPQTPSSPPSHSSVHGLTSQVAALEAKVKAVHHTLHTLQDNTVTSDAKLTEDIDAIKTQHFCFSVQLESFKNLQEKVHTTAINTETAVNNLNDLCVAVQTSLGNLSKAFLANADNSNKTLESLEAQVEAAQGALSMVQTTVGMNNRLLGNLNEQVNILVKAATYQQSASPFSSDEDDSKTCRFKRKRG